jgi:glycosyltransferase involved in cell wall biosynthesis
VFALDLGFDAPWRSLPQVLKAVRKLRRFLKTHCIDILHSHWWLTDYLGALAVIGIRTRLVVHVHAMAELYMPERFLVRRTILKNVLKAADATLVACTEEVARSVNERLGWSGRIRVLENAVSVPEGIDRGLLTFSSSSVLRLCSVGRLAAGKGHLTLIRAMELLREHADPIHVQLTIVGDGPERSALDAEIERLQLSNQVKLLGWQPRDATLSVMRCSDLLVHPSDGSEALPLVILEAMTLRVPVITTTAGAIPRALPPECAMFVEPASASALADGVQVMAEKPDHRQRQVTLAFEFVKRERSFSSYVDRLEELYYELCR